MGTLYVIATPIGNLEDITLRALSVLKSLDLLLCEDTRVTKRLLERYEMFVPMESYREQVHDKKVQGIVARLAAGENVGLVSDAGTPAISDPGAWLVRDVLAAAPETPVVAVPGPSAAIAALSVSGLDTSEFTFLGFPPHKKGRQTFFREAMSQPRTVILYESTHRIMKALEQIAENDAARQIAVGRELTKLHETTYRGTAAEVSAALERTSSKGEFVIVIEGRKK